MSLRPCFLFVLVGLWLCPGGTPVASAAEPRPPPLRALVVTGGHDFETEAFFAMFERMEQVQVTAVAHPDAHRMFQADQADAYDVIVLYDLWQPITEEAKADFTARLQEGKGLVALHHCLASYQAWDEYERIIGGKYILPESVKAEKGEKASRYQHGVDLDVHVADPDHPVTRGLSDFSIHDETYGDYTVRPDAQVLLTTEDPSSTPSICWAKTYGDKARVVYLQLGHDHFAYEHPAYQKLLAQALRWTAAR